MTKPRRLGLLVPVFFLAACAASTPAPLVFHPPSPTPALATTPKVPAAANFACRSTSGGSTSQISTLPAAYLTSVQTTAFPGYDQVVFSFTGTHLPSYSVTTKPDALFYADDSGAALQLQGAAGLLVIFSPATATAPNHPGGHTYTGSLDLLPHMPALREVREVGDYQLDLSWGLGLAAPVCFYAEPLANPIRLVIDLKTPVSTPSP